VSDRSALGDGPDDERAGRDGLLHPRQGGDHDQRVEHHPEVRDRSAEDRYQLSHLSGLSALVSGLSVLVSGLSVLPGILVAARAPAVAS
jgi:hypothetical protein